MSEFKPGDEVVLNCTKEEFFNGVFLGEGIYENCFNAEGVAVVESHRDSGNLVLVGEGTSLLTKEELRYIKIKPIAVGCTNTCFETILYRVKTKQPLYRKVENTLTPMEAAKEACKTALNTSIYISECCDFEVFMEDSNHVADKELDDAFVKVCRAIVEAYDRRS